MIKKNKEILGIIAAIFIAVIVLSIVLIVKNNEKTENTSVSDDACDVPGNSAWLSFIRVVCLPKLG